MLSGPPDTATAISGRGSKPPIAVSAASSSATVSGTEKASLRAQRRNLVPPWPSSDRDCFFATLLAMTGLGSAAASALFLGVGGFFDGGACIRERLVELRQRQTGILL